MKMSSLAASDERAIPSAVTVIQPGWVRATHWINAVAMIVMIMSGWQIYNASPLFAFKFSKSITLGDWLGGPLCDATASAGGPAPIEHPPGMTKR